eukprot:jgi/Undpi1/4898/HiC_scaffold_19.g08250.m1
MLAIMASLVSSMVVQMSVFTYAGYMVEHLGVVDDKDEAGYYAGLMSSSFVIGRLFSSHLWGIAADRLGQRFVLVFGIVSTSILSVVFGCSTTFAVAFTSSVEESDRDDATTPRQRAASSRCSRSHHPISLYEELAMGRESWGSDFWAAEDFLPDGISISLYLTSVSIGT